MVSRSFIHLSFLHYEFVYNNVNDLYIYTEVLVRGIYTLGSLREDVSELNTPNQIGYFSNPYCETELLMHLFLTNVFGVSYQRNTEHSQEI